MRIKITKPIVGRMFLSNGDAEEMKLSVGKELEVLQVEQWRFPNPQFTVRLGNRADSPTTFLPLDSFKIIDVTDLWH